MVAGRRASWRGGNGVVRPGWHEARVLAAPGNYPLCWSCRGQPGGFNRSRGLELSGASHWSTTR